MKSETTTEIFLNNYDEKISKRALNLREILLNELPGVTEKVDLTAKMIAYCYGQKYSDMICVIIPSKKGLKLGFSNGARLPDPAGLLEGNGKLTRYIEIKDDFKNNLGDIKNLLSAAFRTYKAGKSKCAAQTPQFYYL